MAQRGMLCATEACILPFIILFNIDALDDKSEICYSRRRYEREEVTQMGDARWGGRTLLEEGVHLRLATDAKFFIIGHLSEGKRNTFHIM